MYTDPYEFKRSQRSQSVSADYNVYSRKDYNYLPDTNQGVYNNSSLSLVTFDLSSIYNSSRFTDTNDLVVVIPITLVAVFQLGATAGTAGVAGTATAPPNGAVNLLSLKSNYVNLIHQCDVQINGKTCNDLQPYTNVLKNFEMLSEMSHSDLQIFGSTYGIGEVLDNPRSVTYYTAPADTQPGTGLCNNIPFGLTAATVTSTYPSTVSSVQNGNTSNTAITSRLNTIVDTSQPAAGQRLYGAGAIMTLDRLKAEFKPTYEVLGGTTPAAVWYDYAIIRLGSILESLRNIGLTRRFDAVLRLYINTGTVAVPVRGSTAAAKGYESLIQSSSTFTNTLPFTVNYLPGLLDAKTIQITAGCYIRQPPSTSVTAFATGIGSSTAVNLSNTGASHPLGSCRIYYSSIELGDPQLALTYTESNRAKKVIYRNFVSNTITGVNGGDSVSTLVQSGLVNPVAVLVFPFINLSSVIANHVPQFGSPYDTCPSTGSPCSIINFQVTVGGVNQLNTTLQYTYENFMQHVSLYEQITGTDFGLSCGLFDRKYWEVNRAYVCLIRSKNSDMDTPRNINISFQNNSSVRCDYMVFSVYLDSLIIDVDTGRITR